MIGRKKEIGSSKFFVEILTTECSETPSAALKAAMEIHVFEISAAMDPLMAVVKPHVHHHKIL